MRVLKVGFDERLCREMWEDIDGIEYCDTVRAFVGKMSVYIHCEMMQDRIIAMPLFSLVLVSIVGLLFMV